MNLIVGNNTINIRAFRGTGGFASLLLNAYFQRLHSVAETGGSRHFAVAGPSQPSGLVAVYPVPHIILFRRISCQLNLNSFYIIAGSYLTGSFPVTGIIQPAYIAHMYAVADPQAFCALYLQLYSFQKKLLPRSAGGGPVRHILLPALSPHVRPIAGGSCLFGQRRSWRYSRRRLRCCCRLRRLCGFCCRLRRLCGFCRWLRRLRGFCRWLRRLRGFRRYQRFLRIIFINHFTLCCTLLTRFCGNQAAAPQDHDCSKKKC